MDLEAALIDQAERLERARIALPLDPRSQGAWFSLDPESGLRRRLASEDACPPGHWLSPGAALRPLLQQLLLPATAAVVLGPAEKAYWRLTEPLWALVGLAVPRIVERPTVHLRPRGVELEPADLEALRRGDWTAFANPRLLPSDAPSLADGEDWSPALRVRAAQELARLRVRLRRLDRRHLRDLAAARFGQDPERLRQALFPFGRPQERVLPGLFWLRDEALLDRIEAALALGAAEVLVEEA
jgi:hypothetical protein